MKILIADDEAPARARMAALLATHAPGNEIVGEADNGAAVLNWCQQHDVDVVLLDIRMPVMDGIEAARRLARLPSAPAVVFMTAYDEHALAAFDANAIDYLLKPVRPDRLLRALDKARALSGDQVEGLSDSDSFVSATSHTGIQRIPAADIILLKADNKYVEIRHTGGVALGEESLRAIEDRLPGVFLRVHRNALVAPARIRALRKGDEGQILLELDDCEDAVEVSRRHVAQVRRLFRESD